MTGPMICVHGRESSVCFPCCTTAKRPQKASASSSLGSTSPEVQTRVLKSLSDSRLRSEMRDGGGEKPLAAAQRRLGKRGPKPSYSLALDVLRVSPPIPSESRARLERLRTRTREGRRA